MTTPTYGLVFNRESYDPRPAQASDLSVVGIVLPSEDADATVFPLNEPVAFDSGDPAVISKLGTGELAQAILSIDDQLADFQTSARVVAVRVTKGVNDAATMTNIIGSRTATTSAGNVGTGLYALLRAGAQLGVIPRLICAPGYTWQTTAGSPTLTKAANVGNTGNGTMSNPTSQTGAMVGLYKVDFTSATAFTVTDPMANVVGTGTAGTAFSTQVGFTVTAGATAFVAGNGFTITVNGIVQANPVVAALPSICSALLGHAVVGGPGGGLTAGANWAETITSERIIAVDTWRKVNDGAGGTRLEDGVAAAIGLGVRVDFKHGGLPFWSFSGEQVHGTIGLKNYYPFSLTDGATTGQEMLAAHIGVIERGEIGVETAIGSNGFIFAGVWNASTDPIWWFYNKTRGRDWAHLALLKSIRLRLGMTNVTPHGVQAVLNDMVAIGQKLINNQCSVGFRVGFEANRNSPDDLRQGKFTVYFATEEPAPIVNVTIDSRPNYEALVAELGTLVAQAASLPAQYIQ